MHAGLRDWLDYYGSVVVGGWRGQVRCLVRLCLQYLQALILMPADFGYRSRPRAGLLERDRGFR